MYTSKNSRYICDTTNIKKDGCPIELNTVHFGNHVKGNQIGFVTSQPEFFFDTKGGQYQADTPDLYELLDFIEVILTEESKK